MVLSDTIPEDRLPQCWSDDVRMNALFAPFRLKSSNPESWEMKMKFWSDMVRQWCKYKMCPIVSASDIKCAFQRRGRTSACVDIVIEEMYRSGDLAPVSKYHQILHNGPEGWVSWGARLAFKPAVYALTAVSYLVPARQAIDNDGLPKASIESTQRFVLESSVKELATDLLDHYPVGAERVGTVEELLKVTNWSRDRETFEILLGYLVSQGVAVKKGDVVKIAESNQKASPVTESDEALARLLSTEARLVAEAAQFVRDVNDAETEAHAAVRLGNRLAAKNHLKRKKMAQQKLARCSATIDNVRQLIISTKEADSNAAIVDTYRTSTQALKRTMKEGGLEEDAVHDTMDDLKEAMETYNEVEKALGGAINDQDFAELEEELKELMIGPGAPGGGTPGREKMRGADISLPSPPRERPSRRLWEREFVFDGEKQMLEELDHLDEEKTAVPVALAATPPQGKVPKPVKSAVRDRYPVGWGGTPAAGYGELRTDQRIHPGQPLCVDLTSPPRLYTSDFQVQDHRPAAGVWLYNERDGARDEFGASTAYYSTESPGKAGGTFQMAPGGERKHQDRGWTHEHGPSAPRGTL